MFQSCSTAREMKRERKENDMDGQFFLHQQKDLFPGRHFSFHGWKSFHSLRKETSTSNYLAPLLDCRVVCLLQVLLWMDYCCLNKQLAYRQLFCHWLMLFGRIKATAFHSNKSQCFFSEQGLRRWLKNNISIFHYLHLFCFICPYLYLINKHNPNIVLFVFT